MLQWVKDIGLEAILDKVMPQTPVRSQLYFGSNDLQKVDHEDQLYEPIRAAIYDPVNQAASILGLPFEYTTSRGMSWCPHRLTRQCKSKSWTLFFPNTHIDLRIASAVIIYQIRLAMLCTLSCSRCLLYNANR